MASSVPGIVASVAADVGIAGLKLTAGLATRSAVMIAEAAHSLVDGANAALLLVGERRSRRPPSAAHPFGHAGEVYFFTVVVAMVAFVAGGCFALLEGALALHQKGGVRPLPSLLVLGASLVVDAASLVVAGRALAHYRREKGYSGGFFALVRQSHNPPIFVTVLEGLAAIAGVVVAAAGVLLAWLLDAPLLDAVAAMLDGGLLMAVAAVLGVEVHGLIVGESARHQLVDDARRTLDQHPAIDAIEDLRTLQLGPDDVLVLVRARFHDGAPLADLSRLRRDLTRRLRAEHPSIRRLVFE